MKKPYWIAGILVFTAAGAVAFRKLRKKSQKMLYPLATQGRITSSFGNRTNPITKQPQFHNGIDIAAPVGTRIISPADGRIKALYSNTQGGNQLIITHDNGYTTGYAHLSSYAVKLNDRVIQGATIASVGQSGQVTGPHLHFTLKDNKSNFLNPVDYISGQIK